MAVYKGFSTIGRVSAPYSVTDEELIKIDILNELNTIKGERVMMPEYGSIIQLLIMEPLDSITKNLCINDVTRIISKDPRVRISGQIDIEDTDHTVKVNVTLFFAQSNSAEQLLISFTRPNGGAQ